MRTFVLAMTVAVCTAADDKIAPAKGVNEVVDVQATLHSSKDQVKTVLGLDPGADLYVVTVRVRPRGDSNVAIVRDHFTLISRKDGQKTQAMHPSQIAGSTSLMVSSRGPSAGGGMLGQRQGPIWGGIPGTGDRPRRVGGDDEGAVGSMEAGKTESSMHDRKDGENPVLAVLKEKELPLRKTVEPVEGLLYFILEGKHKPKDLELIYKAPGGTLILDFVK